MKASLTVCLVLFFFGCGASHVGPSQPMPPQPPQIAPSGIMVTSDYAAPYVIYPGGQFNLAVTYASQYGDSQRSPSWYWNNIQSQCTCRPLIISPMGPADNTTSGFNVWLQVNSGTWTKQNAAIVPLGKTFTLENMTL